MHKLDGQTIGYLTVIERGERALWRCRCICGKEILLKTSKITGTDGCFTRSCGCKKYELRNKTNKLNGFRPGRLASGEYARKPV